MPLGERPLPPKRFRFILRLNFSGKRIVLIGSSGRRVSPGTITPMMAIGVGRRALKASFISLTKGGKLGGR